MNILLLFALALSIFASLVSGNSKVVRSVDFKNGVFYTSNDKFSKVRSKFNVRRLRTSRKISYTHLKSIEISENDDVFQNKDCVFQLKELGIPEPLILNPDQSTFLRPSDTAGTLTLKYNQDLYLACPGTNNYLIQKTFGQEAVATCNGGKEFKVNGQLFMSKKLACYNWPASSVFTDGQKCLNNMNLHKIGFQTKKRPIPLIEVCLDPLLDRTIYSKAVITKEGVGSRGGVNRPDWKKDGLFGNLDPEVLYQKTSQRKTFSQLLHDANLGKKYISMDNNYFLSRGHLTAKADFIYGAQQLITFHYINAAPQWQTFNGGNWNSLESDVRDFAAHKKVDLEVYTGTYGFATLKDIHSNPVDLYITTVKKIPVPELYWKLVYLKSTKAGVIVAGLNNPWQIKDLNKAVLCTNICQLISWLGPWPKTDPEKGYTFCCEYNDFVKFYKNVVPVITVEKILKN